MIKKNWIIADLITKIPTSLVKIQHNEGHHSPSNNNVKSILTEPIENTNITITKDTTLKNPKNAQPNQHSNTNKNTDNVSTTPNILAENISTLPSVAIIGYIMLNNIESNGISNKCQGA